MASSKHTTTEYNRYKRVHDRFADLFSRLVSFRQTQDWYCEERNKLMATSDYKKLTRYYLGLVNGEARTKIDSLHGFHTHLGWQAGMLEGVSMFEGEWRTLAWHKEQRALGREIDREMIEANPERGYRWTGTQSIYWSYQPEPMGSKQQVKPCQD